VSSKKNGEPALSDHQVSIPIQSLLKRKITMKRFIIITTAALLAAGCADSESTRTAQVPAGQPQQGGAIYPAEQPKVVVQNYYAAPAPQPAQPAYVEKQGDFVGARGGIGPNGPAGSQGDTGPTGSAGYAAVGPRGPVGPAGVEGQQGNTGARGINGDIAVGPTGAAGNTGNAGDQGKTGSTGIQGASADGFAGPAGPAGGAGVQGPTGDTGPKGPTLVGPVGKLGRTGVSGDRGETGNTGAQGTTTVGVAGPAGEAGPAGPAGATGSTGAVGRTGFVKHWDSYRMYGFDGNHDTIRDSDSGKSADIAAYMNANPSLQLGLDGSTNPRATEKSDMDLRDRRIKAVRDSLIAAGVPADRISDGLIGDLESRHDHNVEVFIKSSRAAQAN
jgi:hypothetical protein